MLYGFKLTTLSCSALLMFACSQNNFDEPSCRVNAKYTSSHQGSGACVIRLNDKLLVTQLRSGLYDLPSAHSLSSNDELKTTIRKSAQCLAHEAMWKDTGLNVEVHQVVGAQPDGTWLFACTVNAGFDGTEPRFNAPSWAKPEVQYIAFINPFEIELQNWEKRDHFTVMRDAYVLEGIRQKRE